MSDVENAYPVFKDAIENFERIADKRSGVPARASLDLRSTEWVSPDALNDGTDATFQSLSYSIAEDPTALSGNLAKIGDGAAGILDLHARRNERKAASTSSSVATPLCSASSIAASSSGVAWYTPVRRASMSRACSSNSS